MSQNSHIMMLKCSAKNSRAHSDIESVETHKSVLFSECQKVYKKNVGSWVRSQVFLAL